MLDSKAGGRAAALWSAVSELGWPGVAIAEADGGVGMGAVALCGLAEEVGRAAAPLPLLPSIYLAAQALARFGDAGQKAKFLPSIADGSLMATANCGRHGPDFAQHDSRARAGLPQEARTDRGVPFTTLSSS